ncbi:rRNA-processing protein EBP2 [Knufia obscura]|uniref:rRNA-processing protein EBP2 n=2 Tax=Knufia TaxID=430999 RepID=A0AAN8EBP1_9EURO|nr:rRNA-processing protein EBP2 [Knufia obscura]KAK5951228.1 rRNA-processing protein EBP2 [Knufia fluminis]
MAKKSKLLTALDAQKGRDYEAEKRKKQLKSAEKRKRQRAEKNEENDEEDHDGVQVNGHTAPQPAGKPTDDFEAFESASEDEEDEDEGLEDSGVIPQPETVGDASASEAEQDSDISLSDLEEEDREDVVPHQRMTINNGPALVSSRKRVAVVSDIPQHPFHYHNSLVSADKIADELIPDPMDDETRELMFYKIARDATLTARGLLKKEKVPFTRPADYFAEMVKTEDHMGRVKKKLYDEAAGKKAAEEARKLRDAKKFGKQVQIAKEQERAKDKRDTLNKIQELKRKRKDSDTGRVTEGDNLFEEINVDNDSKRRDRAGDTSSKRQKKDAKFGHGGKKRFSKSGTAESSGDMRGFSAKRMKGKGGPAKRPGKNRRAAARS